MALTTRTNGSTPANIIAASWWNDYKDLLTGVMLDQPVDINNSVNVNSLITSYGQNFGIYIQDSFGAPQRAMHVHTDGDLHLIPSPVNNKLKITKNSYAYDIVVFDLSGITGQTTLNGTLTISGGAASLTCNAITCTTLVAGSFSPTSITTGTLNVSGNQINFTGGNSGAIRNTAGGALDVTAGGSAGVYFYNLAFGTLLAGLSNTGVLSLSGITASGTVNTATLNVSGNQINFTGGNSGAVRNPGGGALEVTAGGSAGVNFFTNSFGTGLGGIDNAGKLTMNTVATNNLVDSTGAAHLIVTTGTGVTRLEDNNKISFQVPGGVEKVSLTASAFHSGLTFDAPVIHFALGGIAKVADGSFYAASGTTINVSNPLANVNINIAVTGADNQTVIWVHTVTTSTITFNWTGAAPFNVNWSAWVAG